MNSLPFSFETKIFHCPEFSDFEYLYTSCFADFEGLYTYLEALPKGDLEGPASGFLRHFSNHSFFKTKISQFDPKFKRNSACSVCDCDGFLGVPKCPTRSPLPIRDSIGACMGAAESLSFFRMG